MQRAAEAPLSIPANDPGPPAGRWRVGVRGLVLIAGALLAIAMIAGVGDPDIMLDAFWVTLVIGAFLHTLRVTLMTIALGAVVTLTFFVSQAGGLDGLELADLAEWPLLMVILVLVTLMADRVRTTAQRYASLYRQASDRLLSAQEEERRRLGRDLHDSVGQTLTAVVLTLDAAEAAVRAAPDAPASSTKAVIGRAQALAATALEETRHVASQLRPPRIREIGLGAAIRDAASAAGIPVEVRFDPAVLPPGLLEPDAEIGALRIVQEAIGNAARHSHAEHVWVDARADGGTVILAVGDDGVGFRPAARSQGLGLANMQERAAMLQGRLAIRSMRGTGSTVELTIPASGGTPTQLATAPVQTAHRAAR